jgi:hypothetical protein
LSVVVKLLAAKLPLNAIVPVVFVNVTAPAATLPLKLVPAELAIVKLPLPAKLEPAITPAVPAFILKALLLLAIAPTVMLLPAVDAPAFVVSNDDVPANVTAFKLIAAALVSTVPFTVVVLAVDVTPFVNTLVPTKVTPPVLEKVAAFVIVLPAFNATLYACTVVSNAVAVNAPLNAIVPVVFVKVTVPAATLPLKLVPAELAIVKLPLPAKLEPAMTPAVPAFILNALLLLAIAPTVMLLPAVDAPAFVVSNDDVPANVTAFKSMAAALVSTVPFTVVVLAVDVTPFVNTLVPTKVTPPVLEKVAAFVIVLPALKATLYACTEVSNAVAVNAPLNAIVPVVFVKVTVPAATLPLKLVPAELAIVKLPLPAKDEPAITPLVPAFMLNALLLLAIAPTVILLPTEDAPAFVVSNEDVPANVTAFKLMAAALVSTVPLTVVVLAVDVTPFVNTLVPTKVTPPVLEKVAAFVIVLPAFKATL